MRRETGNQLKIKTKMAAHVGETHDPGELEDLQMILSLADDADEEFVEDVMLKDAEPFEGKEVTSVFQRLSSSCEESESRFACGKLSKIDNDGAAVDRLGTFIRELNDVVQRIARILKSLKLSCFSGKGKAKQIDTLEKFLSTVEVVNIKYPEKVCTIFFS